MKVGPPQLQVATIKYLYSVHLTGMLLSSRHTVIRKSFALILLWLQGPQRSHAHPAQPQAVGRRGGPQAPVYRLQYYRADQHIIGTRILLSRLRLLHHRQRRRVRVRPLPRGRLQALVHRL
jgi:hypothetical protein